MNTKVLLLALTLFLFAGHSFSQVIGGRDNSEMTPKVAEATKLSGGGFVGDVNVMTGEYGATIPLGTVSTPAGLSYSLELNYTSSFSFGQNRPMTAGIPYGDGWSPNIPTVSVETDVMHKFSCSEMFNDGAPFNDPNLSFNNITQNEFKATDEADLYWFSPMVSIPGVGSGRAIFKYVDVSDEKCLVFVMNKFESPIEIRFYGRKWVVRIADGTTYELNTHLANYRAPSNQRILHYDQDALITNNANQSVVAANDYGAHSPAIQNAIEPKESYSVWYCDLIYNLNTPLQGVRFIYDKYGQFNFYKEYEQVRYQNVRENLLDQTNDVNFSAYTEVILKKVQSYVIETPVDIIELEYDIWDDAIDNGVILDPDNPSNFVVDDMYTGTSIKLWDADFDNWLRYKHTAAASNYLSGQINSINPYVNTSTGSYWVEDCPPGSEAPFDHGFLESDRLGSQYMYPGDIYEIKTNISRDDAYSYDIGNGTIDIAVKSGTLGNSATNETNNYVAPLGGNYAATEFDLEKGEELYSTFNAAVKWQMGHGQATMQTSNFFVMPNVPSTYDGFNIQIGPGNSDLDFSADPSTEYYSLQNPLLSGSYAPLPNVLNAYPFNSVNRNLASTKQIPHNFGTGHPWGMMIPAYNQMALSDASLINAQPDPELLYHTWWSDGNDPWPNVPTKFDETVKLNSVELIRYSKNSYMLQAVRIYHVNGEYTDNNLVPNLGKHLVTQKKLEYDFHTEPILRNYDYVDGNPVSIEDQIYLRRRVIKLRRVREIPLNGDPYLANYGVQDTSDVLTTFLEYTKVLDGESQPYTYDSDEPYRGLTQYLLTGYIDHLGGETRIEYYPLQAINSPSRYASNYAFSSCNNYIYSSNSDNSLESFGKGNSYTAHLAVKFVGRSDEDNEIFDEADLSLSGLKVWEYVYDLNNIILNPKQLNLPQEHFRLHYFNRYDVAFGKVTVFSPALSTGEKNYTEYEFYGDNDGNLTIEDYLYYGKTKSIRNYSDQGVLHDEKIINYGYTQAFRNAYERPNLMREQLGYDDLLARSYEYEDEYKDELLELTDPSGLPVQGPNAYSYLDVPYLNGNFTDREQPKLLDFYFYTLLQAQNPDFFFHSYFVKKTSEINRVYENSLVKQGTIVNPTIPNTAGERGNSGGSGIINSTPYNPETDDLLIQGISNNDPLIDSVLISESPLSDIVLNAVVSASMEPSKKSNVLSAQGGLSNDLWFTLINDRGTYKENELSQMIFVQPYFSDTTQKYLIEQSTVRDNYRITGDLLLKNDYLSDDVISYMIQQEHSMPAEVFTEVIAGQPQLSESALLSVIYADKLKGVNLSRSLGEQVLTDTLYRSIISRNDFSKEHITRLIEVAPVYPSDAVLIDMLELSQFSIAQLTRIFAVADREVGASVIQKIDELYPPNVAGKIKPKPFSGNILSQFCNNAVIEGRTFIETKTEYEYFEADFNGIAVGKGYEMLFGHRSNVDEPSPYPYTVVADNLGAHVYETKIVNGVNLKHEPSWQVFSITTSSDQLPGAYNREEYYYLYDLQNRYDRYWYNYDYNPNNSEYEVVEFALLGSPDTLTYNYNFHSAYNPMGGGAYPVLPKIDGMEKSREYGNRVLAFQKTTISKNTRDNKPLIRSEYYDYDSRWNYNDLPGEPITQSYNGPGCISTPPPAGCDGTNVYDCTDCYQFKYTTQQAMYALVPMGYCAWSSPLFGTMICPEENDVTEFDPNAFVLYCNNGLATNNRTVPSDSTDTIPGGGTGRKPLEAALTALQMRSVSVQLDTLDHSLDQEFALRRLDTKNEYIAEFYVGDPAVLDANGFAAPYEMIPPFDHLKVRNILERNRYLQPALEENQVGLQTKYYYDVSQMYWNVDVNCVDPFLSNNYTSFENRDIGLPTRICVGYNKLDSLSATYRYNNIALVSDVTQPSGYRMEYEFDDYNRLVKTLERGANLNNSREISSMTYNYWRHNFNLGFDQRIDENYIGTTLTTDNQGQQELRQVFMDPLGRNHSVISAYYDFNGILNQIHSGTLAFDKWDRTVRSYKNYSETTSAISASNNLNLPYAEVLYEKNPKQRQLRKSNFGVDVNGIHAVKSNYFITNNIFTACELGLNTSELILIMGPSSTAPYRFIRMEKFDQDDKLYVEYVNAMGQKVASLKYSNNNEKIVTLFVYDSYGNLIKTINPEKQESNYTYNILGQLTIEETVDAGKKKYMYNKQGLVSVILDQQGINNESTGTRDPFYRVFEYDDFGRLLQVGRSMALQSNNSGLFNGNLYGPLLYETTFIDDGSGSPIVDPITSDLFLIDYVYTNISSQDWLVSYSWYGSTPQGGTSINYLEGITSNPWYKLDAHFLEKEFSFGANVNSIEIGKVVSKRSYNNNGIQIGEWSYTYDNYENIASEFIQFNPNGVGSGGVVDINSKIYYPSYNYRNTILEQQVDLNNDGINDYQLFMEYDPLNRLNTIYAASGSASSKYNATKIVSYEHDDANGLVLKKNHYIDNQGINLLVNEIEYQYDIRDRLTNITAGQLSAGENPLISYNLYYDNQVPMYMNNGTAELVNYDANWNGNINGTITRYDFTSNSTIANNVIGFNGATLYGFQYDKVNRLIQADASVWDFLQPGNLSVESHQIGDGVYEYDKIGNLESLHRTLRNTDNYQGAPYTMLDHFNYQYGNGNNRLLSANGLSGTISRNYTYDSNGNVLTDDYKNINSSEYGRSSYPYELRIDSDNNINTLDDEISFLYSADDARIYKKVKDDAGEVYYYYLTDTKGKTIAIYSSVTGWEYYVNGTEREARIIPSSSQAPGSNSGNLGFDKNQVTFFIYDHLGNTRIALTTEAINISTTTTVVNRIDYVVDFFPYGKILREYVNVDKERYLTTQHERDQETGLDYRGARYYDSDIARFLSLDPKARKYVSWSPYNYVVGNPISFVDPSGMGPEDPPDDYKGTIDANTFGQNKAYMDAYFNLMMDAAGGDVSQLLEFWKSGKKGWLDQDNPQEYKFGVAMEQFSMYAYRNAALKKEYLGMKAQYQFSLDYNPFEEMSSTSQGGVLRVDLSLAPEDQIYNINQAVKYLIQNAHESSTGWCAKYVRKAFEAGGISTSGRPGSAKDYDTYLQENKGFRAVNPRNYTPIKGDVVVWEGGSHSEHGHIQMYTGKQWVSDFRQNSFYPYSSHSIPHTILRR